MADQKITLGFDAGDVNTYPFDGYIASEIRISGSYVDKSTNKTEQLPLYIRVRERIFG